MDNYFLMESHFAPFLIMTSYLSMVLFGPPVMISRKPYNLKPVLVVYNMFQIFFNFHLFTIGISFIPTTGIFCTSKYEANTDLMHKILDLQHKYILLKLYDLFDTFLFVLRKKNNQVSFLHVYHHVSMFLAMWYGGKYLPVSDQHPAGPLVFFWTLNTLVHGIMFVYYLLSAVGNSIKTSWWKKYITLLQLVQHSLLVALGLVMLAEEECPYSKIIVAIVVSLVASVMCMFGAFYYNIYVKNTNTDDVKLKQKGHVQN